MNFLLEPKNLINGLLIFLWTIIGTVYCQTGIRGYRLMCYTCMSDNVPQISKDIMKQTINIPDYAESRACNDPFEQGAPLQTGVRMEPCDTACVKVVSENKYLKVVLRGCLNKLYSPGNLAFPLPDAMGSYQDTCDRQRQSSSGIGDTVTDTCLCVRNYCNSSSSIRFGVLGIILPLIALIRSNCWNNWA